ncbi:MAG: hypothetical protein ACTSQY_10990, partial [Candidatus Odinarchaeia archaeon]
FPTSIKEKIAYASRTDAGVSALSQVISFDSIEEPNIRRINSHLPTEIIFWAKAAVPEDFNPRRDVLTKTYYYYKPYRGEDVSLIETSIKYLIGTHDFAKLSKPDRDRNTICTLTELSVELNNNILTYRFTGKSFLWKMVRKIVTLLTLIGKKEIEIERISDILDTGNSFKPQIRPANPEGLILYDISYTIDFKTDDYCVRKLKNYVEQKENFFRVKSALNKQILLFPF